MMEHEPVSNIGRDRLGPDHINFRALNAKKRGTIGWGKEIVPHWWSRFPFRAREVEAAHAGGRHNGSVGLKALHADGFDQERQMQSREGLISLEGLRCPPQGIEQRRVWCVGFDGAQDDLRKEHGDRRPRDFKQSSLLGKRPISPIEPMKVPLQLTQTYKVEHGQRGVQVTGAAGTLRALPNQTADDALLPSEHLEDGHAVLVPDGAQRNGRFDVHAVRAQSSSLSGSNRLPIRSPNVTSLPTTDWPISL